MKKKNLPEQESEDHFEPPALSQPSRDRVSSRLLLAAVALTLAALALYPHLPLRQYYVFPAELPQYDLIYPYDAKDLYPAYWVNRSKFHFACGEVPTVAPGQTVNCGVFILLDGDHNVGADISRFTTLLIDADYSGDARALRISFRNYNPAYSSPNDANSAKFMSINLATSEFNKSPVRIGLNEFTVAEWWIDQQRLDRQFLPLEFNNITTIGLDFNNYLNGTQLTELHVKRLAFEGPYVSKQNFYLGILIVWVSGVVMVLMRQMVQLMTYNRAYRNRIDKLLSDKAHFVRQAQKYQTLSHLDALTGLFNRMGLQEQIKHLERSSDKPAGVIVADIDHFKNCNDLYGHAVGDNVLKGVAQLLQDNIRQNDILARWGGEEFVLVTPNTNSETAFLLAEKLRNIIARHEFQLEQGLSVTCSFGLSLMYPGETFDSVFERADRALYKAKHAGRNCSILVET